MVAVAKTANADVDVRVLLRQSGSLNADEVAQIELALTGEQSVQVRQEWREMLDELEQQSKPSKDLARRVGIVGHLLGRHDLAEQHLAKAGGDAIGDYYHGWALIALGRYAEAAEKFEAAGKEGYEPVECTLLRAGRSAPAATWSRPSRF